MRKGILIVAALAMFAGTAGADLLWDNGTIMDGTNARAISPPGFPDIRVADDVTFGEGVVINDFHANVLEDANWTHGGTLTLTVRADNGGLPGAVVDSHTGEFTRMDTGDIYFGRVDYEYWLEGIDISLDAGTYWVDIRNDGGGGAGTNYWAIGPGGDDGPGSSFGAFSLDSGNTWTTEGAPWHHVFQVTGVPEPTTCLLLGLGGLALLRRRH